MHDKDIKTAYKKKCAGVKRLPNVKVGGSQCLSESSLIMRSFHVLIIVCFIVNNMTSIIKS